ncbi:GL22370 [Drosophila persimilis]|uniref:GL22370 n=1 Tax=Drosophila persimilis TaxID=7234 RepID=B4HCM4_DROPE|nr:GL22370 [Drosophila persimilis]
MDSGNIAQLNEYVPDTQQSSIIEKMNKLDQKLDIMINKLDRNTAEMVALRSEIGSIKAKVCGEIRKPKVVLPCQPLTTIDELDHFEHNLQEESFFKNVPILCHGHSGADH